MFGRKIPLFRILGLEIALDPSWIFLALLITWSLAVGVFPAGYPNLSVGTYWGMGIVGALGLFVSVLIHEISHALVARRYGISPKGIVLFLFGGVAEMEGEPGTPEAELKMAGIGPLVSIGLGLLCGGFLALAGPQNLPLPATGVISYLSSINFVLAAFNLIPAFPLDGGRVLRAVLWKWKNNLREATRLAAGCGTLFGWMLIAFGAFGFLQGHFFGGMWWVLIGSFLRAAARSSYEQLILQQVLKGEKVADFMNGDPVTVAPGLSLEKLVTDYAYHYPHKMFPVTDGEKALGALTVADLKRVPKSAWEEQTVRDWMEPCSPQNTVDSSEDIREVANRMSLTGNTRMLVTQGDRLVGVLALSDILRSLSLRLELAGLKKGWDEAA